jgi:3-hydroxyisobutyrate dehydrogenase-like beta-hydroxyacid dehydrogenase
LSSTETVGFIGLGLMGHGMAKNIVEKGFPLTVMAHRNRAPIDDLVGRGAVEARSPREIAERSSIVVLCVTGSREVEGVIHGENGLKAGLKPGAVIIDCSTADPNSTIALAEELAAAGIGYADAPLGGTPTQAMEGKLNAMVGASDEVFARIAPLIDAFCAKRVHIGGVGDGHKMKLLNNFISLGYAAIYAEALTLASKVGISPERVDSVIRGGRMDCGFYQTFFTWVLERDPNAHRFTIVNALKDLTYLSGFANASQTPNPLGSAVRNSFALAAGAGRGGDFVPMLSDVIAGMNGVKLAEK